MRTVLITLIILNAALINSASAQTDWPFKKFKKQSQKNISLPYSLDKFWLFEKNGSWGLYSETQEKVVVPPNYDLVLPSLEKGFFYIISGQSVGIYSSANQAELIKPGFPSLRFIKDEEGKLYIGNFENVSNEYYTYIKQHPSYLLTQSTNGIWSIGEPVSVVDLKRDDEYIDKDNVMFYKANDWVHNHAHLEIRKREDKSQHILTNFTEESGIISAVDKTYKIPSRYFSIQDRSTFIEVDKVGELEVGYYPTTYTLKGMYTLNYQLIGVPQRGHRGGTISDSGFYFYGNQILMLFDSVGSKVTEINNFYEEIDGILQLNDKYYIACGIFLDDISVPSQLIYSRNGELINQLSFEFDSIYIDANSAKVSVTDIPDDDGGFLVNLSDITREGIFDLSNDQMLIELQYNWIEKRDYKETLSSCPGGSCIYYYEASLDGKRIYFDKDGNTLNDRIELVVSRGDYEIIPIDEKSVVAEQEKDSFKATHQLAEFGEVEEFGDDETHWGIVKSIRARIVGSHHDLVIYETYSDNTQQIAYGLAYLEERYFILAPDFQMIEFDKNTDQVKLTYKDKEYVFPISRYAK